MTTTQSPPLSPSVFRSLVDAARLAPSPDNNQPWAFARSENGLSVYHNRERALPSDVRDLFSWIGMGAVIENIALAFSQRSLSAKIKYQSRPFPVDSLGEKIAAIEFEEGTTSVDPLAAAIEDRVTNRKPYERKPLRAEECQRMAAAVTGDACELYLLTEKPKIKAFANLAAVTDRIRFEHRPFHDEFHSVLRYGETEARQTGDGLELKSLELPLGAGALLKWLKPWNRMRWANRFGMSRAFANSGRKLVLKSGGVGLLVTRDGSDEGLLNAGRMFQRIWLQATLDGLAFQPLGSLPLFLMKFQHEGPAAFLPNHAQRLAELQPEFDRLFPELDQVAPVVAFRVGHAEPPSARSFRLPLPEILVSEN